MNAFGKTDKGLVRASNQDTFRIDIRENGLGFLVLCDGMGGARAGNIASVRAAERFMEQACTADPEQADTETLSRIAQRARLCHRRRENRTDDSGPFARGGDGAHRTAEQ